MFVDDNLKMYVCEGKKSIIVIINKQKYDVELRYIQNCF